MARFISHRRVAAFGAEAAIPLMLSQLRSLTFHWTVRGSQALVGQRDAKCGAKPPTG